MKFGTLLFLMSVGMKFGMGFTAIINKDFRAKLKEKDFTLLIKTKDGKYARSYTFKNGSISSKKGGYEKPELAMIWKDGETAMRILSQAGNPQKLMGATLDGSLALEGDASVMMWFIQAMNQMMGVYGISLEKKMAAGKKKKK